MNNSKFLVEFEKRYNYYDYIFFYNETNKHSILIYITDKYLQPKIKIIGYTAYEKQLLIMICVLIKDKTDNFKDLKKHCINVFSNIDDFNIFSKKSKSELFKELIKCY